MNVHRAMIIRDLAADLGEGATAKYLCPTCGGGNSMELSLSVTKEAGALLWKCHRASCDERGIWCDLASPSVAKPLVDFEPILPTWETARAHPSKCAPPLSAWLQTYLGCDAGYTLAQYECYAIEPDMDTLLFWCRGINGRQLGYHTRRVDVYGGKQCRTYRVRPEPVYAFYKGHHRHVLASPDPNDVLWLVEDPISAIKLAMLRIDSVCLHGVNIHANLLDDARRAGYYRLNLALDRDASLTAIEAARMVRANTGADVLPVLLRKDIKNMTSAEIREVVGHA